LPTIGNGGDEVPVSKFEVGGGLRLEDVFDADLTEIYKGSKNHHLKEIARKSGVDLKVGLRRRHISQYTICRFVTSSKSGYLGF
jgi:hypothetical protein